MTQIAGFNFVDWVIDFAEMFKDLSDAEWVAEFKHLPFRCLTKWCYEGMLKREIAIQVRKSPEYLEEWLKYATDSINRSVDAKKPTMVIKRLIEGSIGGNLHDLDEIIGPALEIIAFARESGIKIDLVKCGVPSWLKI